ncbi:DNA-formamidopyrimidine glycosylase family protein [Microbacterium sp. ASV49]|uniref:DNA-(apurinic or apyrimidinic site) lyase n=1 Tax=Microbacterium candidum TaxID=3041922 RepID=A0ABT7MVT4_9MICO|nr:DNA-formamidopyrimidine glycosylase family protein [Microbacterium sp. ASV49]MDL9978561.1 DNA-formamidopyrimidine glycosylase family protein [Microbacterium sp. ASV49]
MPEGDTVWQAAHRLDTALHGGVVTRFDLRVPRAATSDLTGETVHEVVARGKHILHRIGDYTLHTHLKMEGEWHVYAPGQRWRKPGFRARAVVATESAETVGFDLGVVELVRTADEDRIVGYLGPDPLQDDWDAATAAAHLHADTRPIHVALQDQRNIAGFGNEYASELLFLRGIHPQTPASQTDAEALVALGVRTIRANRDRVNRTFTGDIRNTDWVYGRERRPCRRCGTTIRSMSLGADATRERQVFWCPNCQPDREPAG